MTHSCELDNLNDFVALRGLLQRLNPQWFETISLSADEARALQHITKDDVYLPPSPAGRGTPSPIQLDRDREDYAKEIHKFAISGMDIGRRDYAYDVLHNAQERFALAAAADLIACVEESRTLP